MKSNLDQKLKKFYELKNNEVEQEKINQFYGKEIMPLSIKKFIKTQQDKVNKNYEFFIATVGRSYEPVVYSLLTIQPEKTLFLVTEQSEGELDKIIKFTELKPSQYNSALVNKNQPLA